MKRLICYRCGKTIEEGEYIVFKNIGKENFNYRFCSWMCVYNYVRQLLDNFDLIKEQEK